MRASRIVFTAFFGCTLGAFAQVPPPANTPPGDPRLAQQPANGQNQNQRDANQNRNQSGQQDNRAADQNNQNQNNQNQNNQNVPSNQNGPEIVDDPNATPEQRASAEYSGPAVLSRGISASEPMNPKNTKLTPNLGIEYIYNNGLTGTTLQDGHTANAASSGVQLHYGISGEKLFKNDRFNLTFVGNLYHYAQTSGYDGTDNQLALTWTHRLSRHLSFAVRQSFEEYNRNNLLLSGSELINTGLGTTLVTASPATEAFDGRVITGLTEGSLTYKVNARLSFNLSGGGFLTRRESSALYGDTGYQAGADLAYRLTKRQTIGAYYSYTHFDYIGTYGGSDINTVGLAYSIAFNPRTQLITRFGGSRLETTGLTSVSLDPILQFILGRPSTILAIYRTNYTPDINVQLRRRLNNFSVSMSYERGITPGNGVILTSVRQSGVFGIDYKLRRTWNLSATSGYDSLSGYGATVQKYGSVFVGGGLYRRVAKQLDWHARVDWHHYTFDQTGFLRNSFVFSTGLVWTPGEMLERLW